MVRGRTRNLDSRKKLKCLYFAARDNIFPHMLQLNVIDDTFVIIVMNKNNGNWEEKFLDLFKEMDNTDLKKAAEYRAKESYDTDCRHRFFQNMHKLRLNGLLKRIKVIKTDDSFEMHYYQFLDIPDSWRDPNESYEFSYSEEVQEEMSYETSPVMSASVLPLTPANYPIGDNIQEEVVLIHIPEIQNGSSGNVSPTSKIVTSGMEMSYLLSLPLMTHYLKREPNSGFPISKEELILIENEKRAIEEMDISESKEVKVISNTESYLLQPSVSSNEKEEKNISPTSEAQDLGMGMSYLNSLFLSDILMVDSNSSTESVLMQPAINSQNYSGKNYSPTSEELDLGMEMPYLKPPYHSDESMIDSSSSTESVFIQSSINSQNCLEENVPDLLFEDKNIDLSFLEEYILSPIYDEKSDVSLLPKEMEDFTELDYLNTESVYLKEDSPNKTLAYDSLNEKSSLIRNLGVWN